MTKQQLKSLLLICYDVICEDIGCYIILAFYENLMELPNLFRMYRQFIEDLTDKDYLITGSFLQKKFIDEAHESLCISFFEQVCFNHKSVIIKPD